MPTTATLAAYVFFALGMVLPLFTSASHACRLLAGV
jgi:hypothetical protein